MNSVVVVIIIVLVVFVGIIYNSLVKARNNVREKCYNLEFYLKKRWDLLPIFVEIVEGYSFFEEQTIEKIAKIREQKYEEFKIEQKLEVDNNISKVVNKIFEIAENYSDLKENEEYIKLSNQFVNIEKNIESSKKDYYKSVKEYNSKIEVVPNNVVAILFGFNEEK